MSRTPDAIRAAILRRRAAFVGSALALGGCTPSAGDGAPTSTAPTVTLPSARGEPPPVEPPATASAAAPSDRPPPLMVPVDVSDAAKANYQRLNDTMQKVHELLDSIEKDLPSCDLPKGGACADAFGVLADRLGEIEHTLRFFHICPGSSEEAKHFRIHHDEHLAFVRSRRAQVIAAVEAAAGAAGADAWAKVQADRAQPVPCLSFACPDW